MAILIDAVLKARLHEHVGHKIEIIYYGSDKDADEVEVECASCGETLIRVKAQDENGPLYDKAILTFRKNLVSRLREDQEMCHADPEGPEFKSWLSAHCSEAELSMMAAWEDEVGTEASRLYLRSCQLDAQK